MKKSERNDQFQRWKLILKLDRKILKFRFVELKSSLTT